MRLISCHIEGFGKLNNIDMEFTSGVNTILRENGWGKTTFAAFVKVMFYGFSGETKRNDIENERRRFRPWSGGAYGGELVFESGTNVYRVQRAFGGKKSEDTFALYDAETNAVSRDFTENIGYELFQIDARSFENTVYIGQNSCQMGTTDDINAKIGNIAATDSDINNYEKACQTIKSVVNRMSPNKRNGELYRQKMECAELSEKARKRQYVCREIDRISAQRDKVCEKKMDNSELRYLTAQQRKLSRYFGGKVPDGESVALMTRKAREYDRLQAQLDMIESISDGGHVRDKNGKYSRYPTRETGGGRKTAVIVLLICVFVLVAGYFITKSGSNWIAGAVTAKCGGNVKLGYIIMALAGICMILDIVYIVKINRKTADIDYTSVEKLYDKREVLFEEISSYLIEFGMETGNDVLRQMTEFQMRYDEYTDICDRLRKEKYELQRASDEYMSQMSKEEYMSQNSNGKNMSQRAKEENMSQRAKEDRMSQRSGGTKQDRYIEDDTQEMVMQYDRMLSDLRAELNDIDETAKDMEARKDKLADRLHRYDLVVKTGELLMEARDRFNSRYTQPVAKAFGSYCAMISENIPQDMRIDPDMGILYRSDGLYRNSETLSSGLSDIVSVCLRAALADVMYPGEKPVLILDDPFVNLDDVNRDGAMRLMSVISKKYQVIYFTCSENRVL